MVWSNHKRLKILFCPFIKISIILLFCQDENKNIVLLGFKELMNKELLFEKI